MGGGRGRGHDDLTVFIRFDPVSEFRQFRVGRQLQEEGQPIHPRGFARDVQPVLRLGGQGVQQQLFGLLVTGQRVGKALMIHQRFTCR